MDDLKYSFLLGTWFGKSDIDIENSNSNTNTNLNEQIQFMNKLCSKRINIDDGETKPCDIITKGINGTNYDLLVKIKNEYSDNSVQILKNIDGLKTKLLESNENKTPRDMYNNLDTNCDIYCNLLNIT